MIWDDDSDNDGGTSMPANSPRTTRVSLLGRSQPFANHSVIASLNGEFCWLLLADQARLIWVFYCCLTMNEDESHNQSTHAIALREFGTGIYFRINTPASPAATPHTLAKLVLLFTSPNHRVSVFANRIMFSISDSLRCRVSIRSAARAVARPLAPESCQAPTPWRISG